MKNICLALAFLATALTALADEQSGMPVAFDSSLKGKRVSVTVEVENTGAYAVGNRLSLHQFDAEGRRLMEDVCDPRFLSFMRPAGLRHAMTVEGSIHPRTAKIELASKVFGEKPAWKECPDAAVKIVGVKIAAAPKRSANKTFFTEGVDGRALDLHDFRAFFFPVYSRACWGQGLTVKDPDDLFYPAGEGTVEAWIRPEWGEGLCTLFDAANLAPGAANAKNAKGSLFRVEYDPGKRTVSFSLKGDDGKTFAGKGTCDIASGAWHHVAVTFAPGGEAAAFVGGKKVASASLEGYVPPKGGDQKSGPMLFAFGGGAKLIRTTRRRDIPVFAGALDNLRLSSVVRYGGDFTPERSLRQDAQTRSLFRFEDEIDGVSAGADGIVEASILAGEALYPGGSKPKFEKEMPFDVLNYRKVPSEKDYLSLSKASRRTFRLKPGETAKFRLPEDAVPDFTEIANNGSEVMVAPLVRHPGEVDPRSYDTIRATIGLEGLTDRQKADRLFSYAIRSTDYFIWQPANVMKEKLWTFGHNNAPLRNLNVYGSSACGGLNKVAANLFTLCGDLPANTVCGYGHEFEHVLFDGKARVYDLANQQYFDSLRDDESASLQEIEREPSTHVRYTKSANHFTRLFAHSPWNSSPDYGQRFFVTLKPGERFRWWRRNDGTFNDVWRAKKAGGVPLRHPLAAPAPASCPIGNAYLYNRFAPDFANGFVVYEGRALEKGYSVDFAYTVVRGEYRAEGADGKPRAIELSRDLGKTWNEMPADADGTVRLDYAVRGHYNYIVRAKGGEPSRFRAMTELQMNPRVLTGLACGGENEFLFTAQKGGAADVTVGWREAAGPIKVSGVAFAGGVPGAERLVAAVDPSSGPTVIDVEGVASVAVEKGALDAELKGGRLVLSARAADRPFYGLVMLKGRDAAAKRSLAVLVGRGARLAFAGDGMKGKMLEKAGEKASLRFDPVEPGRFMVFNLTRVPGGLPHTRVGARPLAQVVDPKARRVRNRLSPCAGTSGANDWYEAAFGEPGSRAAYHWDYAQDPATSYPNGAPRGFDGNGLDHVDFEMTMDYPGGIELFAAMVIPEGDHAFQCETLKMFINLSYDLTL